MSETDVALYQRMTRVETLIKGLQRHQNNLFEFIRDHMEKEEAQQKIFCERLDSLDNQNKARKAKLGGMAIVIAALGWAFQAGLITINTGVLQ